MIPSAFPGHPLEATAEAVLRNSGYSVTMVTLGQEQVTMAEDPYSLIALVGADTWESVSSRLSGLQILLANWTSGQQPGPKVWDTYLVVLLAARLASHEELSDVRDLVDDLRFVRKIVRPGVHEDRESVERALAPFLSLKLPDRPISAPLDVLERRLLESGLDASLVRTAVASFRETGEVNLP